MWTLLSRRVKEERIGRGGGGWGRGPSLLQAGLHRFNHSSHNPCSVQERNHPQPDYLLAWTDHTSEATVLQHLPFNSNSLVGVILPPPLAVKVAYL